MKNLKYLLAVLLVLVFGPLLHFSARFRRKIAPIICNLCFGSSSLRAIFPLKARIVLTDKQGFAYALHSDWVEINEKPVTPEHFVGLFWRSARRQDSPRTAEFLSFGVNIAEPLEKEPVIDSFKVIGEKNKLLPRGFLLSYRFVVIDSETAENLDRLHGEKTNPNFLLPENRFSNTDQKSQPGSPAKEISPEALSEDENLPQQNSEEPQPSVEAEEEEKDEKDFRRDQESERKLDYMLLSFAEQKNGSPNFPVPSQDVNDGEKLKRFKKARKTAREINRLLASPAVYRNEMAVAIGTKLGLTDPEELLDIFVQDGNVEIIYRLTEDFTRIAALFHALPEIKGFVWIWTTEKDKRLRFIRTPESHRRRIVIAILPEETQIYHNASIPLVDLDDVFVSGIPENQELTGVMAKTCAVCLKITPKEAADLVSRILLGQSTLTICFQKPPDEEIAEFTQNVHEALPRPINKRFWHSSQTDTELIFTLVDENLQPLPEIKSMFFNFR